MDGSQTARDGGFNLPKWTICTQETQCNTRTAQKTFARVEELVLLISWDIHGIEAPKQEICPRRLKSWANLGADQGAEQAD